jgi:hypothetical protein
MRGRWREFGISSFALDEWLDVVLVLFWIRERRIAIEQTGRSRGRGGGTRTGRTAKWRRGRIDSGFV